MGKIETLTPEQWAQMREFREDQRRTALRTDAIDEGASRAAVKNLYVAAGRKEPEFVFVFQSPIQCLMARGLLQLGGAEKLRGQLGDQLGGQLGDQLGGQLRGQLWGQLGGQLRGQLGDQLGDQLWGQLGGQLGGGELHQNPYFIGGWDSFWLAFYEFGRQIGVKYSEKTDAHFNAYRAYADVCGVSFLYQNVALISDRPERISFDHLRRLHAEDGPALRYRDGYAIYAWRGQRVQPDVIEKRLERTAKDVRAEKNAESRRILTEIYAHIHGPGKIIQDMGAKLLSEDTAQDRPRRLYNVDGARFIHVINGSLEPDGSRREFFLGANPDSKTPHEAIAASYGRPVNRYVEAVRT